MPKRSHCFPFLLAASCLIGSSGRAQVAGEYQVKAAFLYNLARFVEWPPGHWNDPATPFQLCVLGEDPFGADLDRTVRGKNINGREVRISRSARIENLPRCDVLFVSASEQGRLPVIFAALGEREVLTVGDMAPFAQMGGIINFTLVDNSVRFEINIEAADRAGLSISSQLLKLATVVRSGTANTAP